MTNGEIVKVTGAPGGAPYCTRLLLRPPQQAVSPPAPAISLSSAPASTPAPSFVMTFKQM